MNQQKTGELIRALRLEKQMTQKQLADALGLSDRTVSKWERGAGCPDVSLLGDLAALLGVPVEKILAGELSPRQEDGGNMKRVQFYCCPVCGNVMTSAAPAQISCCGRALQALKEAPADGEHTAQVEEVDGESYVTFAHPMTKEHHIRFAALVGFDRVTLVRLYPEQGGEVRLPRIGRAKLYLCCSQHGLFRVR